MDGGYLHLLAATPQLPSRRASRMSTTTSRTLSQLTLALLVSVLGIIAAGADESVHPAALSSGAPAATNTPKMSRCTVRKDANGWWLVTPAGEPFFSLGICMCNQGGPKEKYDPTKPSYTALRHYDMPEAWADASVLRLKSWGFTTVGGWSDYKTLRQSRHHDLWITPVLHLGSRSGAPWFDMWDEKVVRRIQELAEESIVPLRDDARVLGYYSDNEIGWWNAILWKMTLEQPATSGQRQQLVAMVREVYHDDWNSLAKDFVPQDAANWQDLERAGMLWLRPGSDGIRTIRRFLGLVAARYYQLMNDTIARFDPDALYLGDRYQSFYYPEVPLASRPYVDVVSTNFNVSWNDGTFVDSYLETLHKLADKPVLVSEFYMAAEENRSGNKNAVGGFPTVATQRERAAALSNTLRSLGRLPYVVGADWFQYYDEPPHGRTLDGEDYNFGLVDIHNQPYEEVTAAFSKFDLSKRRSEADAHRVSAADGVPPAPTDPFGAFKYMRALKQWDRERGLVRPNTEHPLGDLYICWSPTALYLGTFVIDIVEPDYYRDGQIPEIDRAEWTVRINGAKPIAARLGAGKDPTVSEPAVRIQSISGIYHDVRCVTVIEVPAEYLGKKQLAPGDEISLDSNFTTHARANRVGWEGKFVLGE